MRGTRPTLTLRFSVFALKMRTHEAMRLYQHNKIFCVGTPRRAVRAVACAAAILLRRAAILAAVLARRVECRRVFFRPGGLRTVPALVRARTAGFRPRRRVCTKPTPARSGLRALPTLYASAVKDWRRSFWSAVLQHRFRFDWRDDFRVVQSSVQAEPRTAASSNPASPSNAEFTSLQSGARRSAP